MTGTIRNKPTRCSLEKGSRRHTRSARARVRASNYSVSANKRRFHRKEQRVIVDDQTDERDLHIDNWDIEHYCNELDEYFKRIEKIYGPISEW